MTQEENGLIIYKILLISTSYFWSISMRILFLFLAFITVTFSHDKIVTCYWGTWSFFRPGDGRFDVTDIDPSLCTHGIYAFALVDNITWTIKPGVPW